MQTLAWSSRCARKGNLREPAARGRFILPKQRRGEEDPAGAAAPARGG